MLYKRGKWCFANGNVKDEFVLKHVYSGEDTALSSGGFSDGQHFLFPLWKKTLLTSEMFPGEHFVVTDQYLCQVSWHFVFVMEWFGFIFSLISLSAVMYSVYMKSNCNLKLGIWHASDSSKLLWIIEDGSELTLACKKLGFWQINASLCMPPWKISNQGWLCPLYSLFSLFLTKSHLQTYYPLLGTCPSLAV